MSSANRPRGGNAEFFIKEQAGGFSVAATGDYQPTLLYDYKVAKSKPLDHDPILGLSRHNSFDSTAPAPGLETLSGSAQAPLDFAHAGLWLKGAFGAPATSGAPSDYTHVFTSGLAVLPERTITRRMAKASGSIILQHPGIMVDGLSIQASRQGGYARLGLDLVGYDEVDLVSTLGAGTPGAIWARDPIAAAHGVYKIDSVQAAVLECKLDYKNNLQSREEIGDARMAGYEPGEKTLTGSLRLRLRDLTLVNAAEAGTAHAGELLFQKSSVRLLKFEMPVVRLERPSLPVEGPDGIDVTFNMRAEQSDSAPMVTATLKGGVATYTGF